jgi:hypothetical protein
VAVYDDNPHHGQDTAVLFSRAYVFAASGGRRPGVAFLILALNAIFTEGYREAFPTLPVLFWRVSLAALSSREPGERRAEQGEPGGEPRVSGCPTGVTPHPATPPGSLESTDATLLPEYFWPL